MALRSINTQSVVKVIYGGSSYLFVGVSAGHIEAWDGAGEAQHAYKGHTNWVWCMLEHAGHLWSGSRDNTVRVWNIQTRECIRTIQCQQVHALCEWQGNIMGGSIGGMFKWNSKGDQLAEWSPDNLYICLAVWVEWFCSVFGHDIQLWKEGGPLVMTLTGHRANVSCITTNREYLFSGSRDQTIKKWNTKGECLATFTHHTSIVSCLLVRGGELYSGSWDKTVQKCTLDGTVLQLYKGHKGWVTSLILWRGALFSNGDDRQLIQWTDFPVWSPVTHHLFSSAERAGIKTMMVLARKHKLGRAHVPREVLYIILQMSIAIAEDIKQKRIKQ